MAAATELTCQQLVEILTDYLEGALDQPLRDHLEAHLAGCAGCTAYLAQIQATVRLLGRVPPAAITPEMCDRLLEAFRDWPRRHEGVGA